MLLPDLYIRRGVIPDNSIVRMDIIQTKEKWYCNTFSLKSVVTGSYEFLLTKKL